MGEGRGVSILILLWVFATFRFLEGEGWYRYRFEMVRLRITTENVINNNNEKFLNPACHVENWDFNMLQKSGSSRR